MFWIYKSVIIFKFFDVEDAGLNTQRFCLEAGIESKLECLEFDLLSAGVDDFEFLRNNQLTFYLIEFRIEN